MYKMVVIESEIFLLNFLDLIWTDSLVRVSALQYAIIAALATKETILGILVKEFILMLHFTLEVLLSALWLSGSSAPNTIDGWEHQTAAGTLKSSVSIAFWIEWGL